MPDGRLTLVTVDSVDQRQMLVKAITFQLITDFYKFLHMYTWHEAHMSSVMPKHRPKTLQFDPSAIITRPNDNPLPCIQFQGQKPFCVLLTQRASLASDSAHFRELAHKNSAHGVLW